MHLKRFASACAVSVGLALATAMPASADDLVITAGDAGATVICGYGQTCTGAGQLLPGVGLGGGTAAFSCTVVTPYVVSATVASCFILGSRGDVHRAPDALTQGQVSTTQADAGNLTSTSYQLCIGGGFFNGFFAAPANYQCFQPVVIDTGISQA